MGHEGKSGIGRSYRQGKTLIHVTHIIEPTIGGTRRHLLDLLDGLDTRGVTCSLICSIKRDPRVIDDVKALRASGMRVDLVPMHRIPTPVSDAVAYRRIHAILRETRPDLVHTHSSKAGILGRFAAHRLGIKTVHTPHVFPFEMKTGKLLNALFTFTERQAAKRTSLLISVSKHGERLARQTFGRHAPISRVIYNGIETAPYTDVPSLAPDPPAVIGLRARLCRQKGQDIALRTIATLIKTCPKSKLIIQGEGDVAALRARAARLGLTHCVEFMMPSPSPLPFLSTVTVVIQPSRWEGIPYSMLEAIAAGRPVVSTDVGGVREVITHEETGMLIPSGQPESMAMACKRLVDEAELRCRITQQAKSVVAQRFRRDEMFNRTVEAYHQLQSGNNRASVDA